MASTWEKQAAGILRMWTLSSTVQCLQSQPEVSGHLTVLLPPLPQSPEQDFIMRTAGTFSWDCEGGRSRWRGLEGKRGQSREKQPSQPGACAAPSSAWVTPQQGDHTALPRHSSLSGRPKELRLGRKAGAWHCHRPLPGQGCCLSSAIKQVHRCRPCALQLGPLRVPLISP